MNKWGVAGWNSWPNQLVNETWDPWCKVQLNGNKQSWGWGTNQNPVSLGGNTHTGNPDIPSQTGKYSIGTRTTWKLVAAICNSFGVARNLLRRLIKLWNQITSFYSQEHVVNKGMSFCLNVIYILWWKKNCLSVSIEKIFYEKWYLERSINILIY